MATTMPRMRNSSEPAKMTVANTGAHHHCRGDCATTTPKAIPIGSAPMTAGKDARIANRMSPGAAKARAFAVGGMGAGALGVMKQS